MEFIDKLYNKKTLIILGIIILILVILVLINQKAKPALKKIGQVLTGTETIEQATTTVSTTEAVSINDFKEVENKKARVPEPNEILTAEQKKEIAVPTVAIPAAQGSSASFRSFNISAENNKFIPERIFVNVGDTVNIKFTVVDKDYDIIFESYNTRQKAVKGETKALEFQAVMRGDFIFYCKLCGGINSSTKGIFTVIK
jgi:plastocyanin